MIGFAEKLIRDNLKTQNKKYLPSLGFNSVQEDYVDDRYHCNERGEQTSQPNIFLNFALGKKKPVAATRRSEQLPALGSKQIEINIDMVSEL